MSLTLDDLLAALEKADPNIPASFTGPDGATQGHWHLTRITFARQDHVDCDGGRDNGVETVLELLDGPPGAAMPVSRLGAILRKCRDALPEAGSAPLQVFHQSTRFTVRGVINGDVRMSPVHAACRPAQGIGCCA